ncbi:hypothetical protein Avbf_18697 [Armadillidium vulgare]|nr:hypothetical protein Avbf_18697 [Armadillidium vulgare]
MKFEENTRETSQSCQKEKEKHEIDNLLEMKLPDWSRLKNGNLVDCQNSVWKCLEETSHSVLALAKKSQIEIISDIKILNISKSVTLIPSGLRKYFDNYFIIT